MQRDFNPVLKEEAMNELIKRFDGSAPTEEDKTGHKSRVTTRRSADKIRAAYWKDQ